MNFQKAEFELSAGKKEQLPVSDLPEIVFSGRSNVGKSSLINKLVNRKALARTSSTPGKTATINFFRVDSCRFVDLPGYGYAKVSKGEKERWAELVEGYFAQNRRISLVLQLVDMRRDPTADDFDMIRFLLETGVSFAVVCTKSDKLNKTETTVQRSRYQELFSQNEIPFYAFSAVSGAGVEELRELLSKAVSETVNGESEKGV